jgi:hypothetical protein
MGVESSTRGIHHKCIYNFDQNIKRKYFLKELSVCWGGGQY